MRIKNPSRKFTGASSILIAAICLAGTVRANPPPKAEPAAQAGKVETKEQRDARMAWWREAKFGLFIHWGVYSVPAGFYHDKPVAGIGEWIMNKGKIPMAEYQQFAKEFMALHGLPTAKFEILYEAAYAKEKVRENKKYPVVIKADGLAAGKGVRICKDEAEALR